MPLYEYECDACHHRFEKIQKFSDPLVDTCPECGKQTVKKLLSSPAIQFKGTGWYITDYPKKSMTDAGKTGDGPKSDSSKGDSGGSTPSTGSTPAPGGGSDKKS